MKNHEVMRREFIIPTDVEVRTQMRAEQRRTDAIMRENKKIAEYNAGISRIMNLSMRSAGVKNDKH